MNNDLTFDKKILRFNEALSSVSPDLPEGFRLVNPYTGGQKEKVAELTRLFYKKYYNDNRKRYLILGSSPARRGSAVTGVPFVDAKVLQQDTGIILDNFLINRQSSDFLTDVITAYGGRKKFYAEFYMNFVCPLGVCGRSLHGNEINCNYYDNSRLKDALNSFIIKTLRWQVQLGIHTSVCYCIGSGENYRYLSTLNELYHFFEKIIPLEHPRFITQYNSKRKNEFLEKYISALNNHY